MNRCLFLFSALVAGCAMGSPAHAATAARSFYQNGGSACTGALPTYEGALRKRPKAIANEGTSVAFVTCSASGDYLRPSTPTSVYLWVTNRNSAYVNLNCTLINGDEKYGSISTPLTMLTSPGIITQLYWVPVAPAQNFPRHTISVSCALPPGVEINTFGHTVSEGVGS